MKNFNFSLPTNVHFGRGQIEALPRVIAEHGSRVLLVYGGGSIKKNGLYEQISKLLHDNGIFFQELSGVQPNPRVASVRAGAALCRATTAGRILRGFRPPTCEAAVGSL